MTEAMIETARLALRPYRLDDLPARIRLTADPAVMRHVGGVAQSAEENHARILRYAGQWALLGTGMLAIEEKGGGGVIGEVGVADFHRGLGPDFDGRPEAAWILASSVWGRGYGFEAAGAVLAWHERRFGTAETVCIVAPENLASLALARKLGFRPTRTATYHDRPVLIHGRNRPLHKPAAEA